MVRIGIPGCLWLAGCASAAYVQWQHCDSTSPDDTSLIPQSLSARMERINGTHHRLALDVSRWVDEAHCPDLVRKASVATLDIQMLGYHSSHQLVAEGGCRSMAWSTGMSSLVLTFIEDIGALYPLSTFGITIQLEDDIFERERCIRANITPEIDAQYRLALSYVPLGIFLFVLLAGFVRSVYGGSSETGEADAEDCRPRSILPNVGDCLHYLQFVFLTGSLSLYYPGSYQPVVSHLSLYSLFSRGMIRPEWQYEGVSDGIYVVNGTYGGTFGLELMTQVVGAPLTWGTWLNMVVSVGIIALAAAIVLELYRFVNHISVSDRHYSPWTGLRHTSNHVSRGVLSYFMLPLVALSSYQLVNAGILPAYHTSLAVLFIVVIIITFVWLLRQIPIRSLGILIFDNSNRYRQMPVTGDSTTQENSFVFVLFLLSFIRGVAIGGLQISATAQLVVLVLCEIILLASIVAFQAYSILSIGTTSVVARLCSLFLMVAFIPGLGSHHPKVAIGYMILVIHACMLTFGFLIPIACSLVKLGVTRWRERTPNVYGLRQLHRRQNSRNNLAENCNDSCNDTPVEPSAAKGSPGAHPRPSPQANSSDGVYNNTNRYYRPPRASRSSASIPSAQRPDRPAPASLTINATGSSSTASPIPDSTEHWSVAYTTRASSSTNPQTPSSESSGDTPLGPRWADYSFREADLFYCAPPPDLHAAIPNRAAISPRQSSSSSTLWTRFTGSQSSKKSFQVSRPALDARRSNDMMIRMSGLKAPSEEADPDKDNPD